VLHGQHAARKRAGCVAFQHRHNRLRKDGAMVEFGRDRMHRGPMESTAIGQHPSMGVEAFVGGQQRGVDVEQTPSKGLTEWAGENAHEAGEHDEVGRMGLDGLGQCVIEGLTRGKTFVIDDLSVNAAGRCSRKALGLGAVRDHCSHIDGPAPRIERIQDGHHVAAASGDEHDQSRFHQADCMPRPIIAVLPDGPMRILRGLQPACPSQDHAVTIGSFDGLHHGHQALLHTTLVSAQQLQVASAVITFEPHPRAFFTPAAKPPRILLARDKFQTLKAMGIETVWVLPFRRALASMPADAFIDNILVRQLRARTVVVGQDFRFGAKRGGSVESLQAAGQAHGFSVQVVDPIRDDQGEVISSSMVRRHLQAGDLDAARRLMGRPLAYSGHVIHGQALGRTLGFPTLNLLLPDPFAVSGIYAVWVSGLGPTRLRGVASIGRRPTVEAHGRPLLEVHLLDWQGHAYGACVSVELARFIRHELAFDSLEALTAQMQLDRQIADQSLST
jgi:riboflavin kinase/FMN adenylyltransferase